MRSVRQFRLLFAFSLLAYVGVARSDDAPNDEAVKSRVAQLEKKAKDATVRAVQFEEQADRSKVNVERTRLYKEAKAAREEAADARVTIRYIEVRHLESKFNPAVQRAMALLEQASKATTDQERARLGNEANAARSEALDIQKRVRRTMDELAPSDRMGYAPAHIWQADLLVRMQQAPDGQMVPPTRGQLLQAERHLSQASESSDPAVKLAAKLGLARILFETERKSEAKALMAGVAESNPEYHFVLAQWALKDGKKDDLVAHARLAANEFQNRINARSDDHPSRLSLVDCLIMLNEFEEAKALLTKSALEFDRPEIRRAYMSKSSVVAIAQLDARGKDVPLAERLQRLDEALRTDPTNTEVFGRLLAMAQAGGPVADQVREAVSKLTGGDNPSGMAHLYLGLDAWYRKDSAKAREHWEVALKLTDGSPIIANNLAWDLAHTVPIDLERALKLVDEALKKMPSEARFKSTRGHILAKLNRPREALPELLAATAVYSNDPNLYRVLSDVMGKLGDKRKADEFTKKAALLAAAEKKAAAAAANPKSP